MQPIAPVTFQTQVGTLQMQPIAPVTSQTHLFV